MKERLLMHLNFNNKLASAALEIKKAGCDALLMGPSADLEYLFGLSVHKCERFNGVFLLATGEVFGVVSKLYLEEFKRALPSGTKIYEWADEEWFFEALERAFKEWGFGEGTKIAVNDGVAAMDAVEIANRHGVHLVNGWQMLEPLRLIKSQEEIAKLKKAGEITDRALEALLSFIRPGRKEKEIRRKLLELMDDLGATSASFPPIVARGEHASMPHYTGGDGVIRERDTLLIDFGCRFEGYCSDMTRTLFIGEPDPEIRKLYEIVRRAQEEGEKHVRPGVTAESVDEVARKVIVKAGYGEYFNNRVGHGIGIAIHEAPYIMRGNRTPLQKGMTFSVEPGIYIPGKVGIRIENCVFVTDEGCQSFTSFPKELVILSS